MSTRARKGNARAAGAVALTCCEVAGSGERPDAWTQQHRLALRRELEDGNVLPVVSFTFAETGVQRISIGALTHSAPSLDIALDWEG